MTKASQARGAAAVPQVRRHTRLVLVRLRPGHLWADVQLSPWDGGARDRLPAVSILGEVRPGQLGAWHGVLTDVLSFGEGDARIVVVRVQWLTRCSAARCVTVGLPHCSHVRMYELLRGSDGAHWVAADHILLPRNLHRAPTRGQHAVYTFNDYINASTLDRVVTEAQKHGVVGDE